MMPSGYRSLVATLVLGALAFALGGLWPPAEAQAPIVLKLAREQQLPASRLLMPMSLAASLGTTLRGLSRFHQGTCTDSSALIVSITRRMAGGAALRRTHRQNTVAVVSITRRMAGGAAPSTVTRA